MLSFPAFGFSPGASPVSRGRSEAAGIASAYAQEHNLRDVSLQFGVQASDFKRMRLDDRVRQAQTIVDALRPLLPQLAEFGLTAAALDAVQATVTAGDQAATTARELVAHKSAATHGLRQACLDIDQMLTGRIDALLRPLRRTHRQFYENYLAVRKVMDRPGGHAADDGEVVPLPTSAPNAAESRAA